MSAQLAATRAELSRARADNAALMRRLMKERNGAQLQLESTVAFWMDRVAECEMRLPEDGTDRRA